MKKIILLLFFIAPYISVGQSDNKINSIDNYNFEEDINYRTGDRPQSSPDLGRAPARAHGSPRP